MWAIIVQLMLSWRRYHGDPGKPFSVYYEAVLTI